MRVLFLDDDLQRHAAFARLAEGEITHVETAKDAISQLEHGRFDVVSLDHDLGGRTFVESDEEETGYQVAKALTAMPITQRPQSVVVHSWNPAGAERMARRIDRAGIRVSVKPFGTWFPSLRG